MSQTTPETVYNERINHIDAQLKVLLQKDRVMGILKLVLVVIGVLGLFRVFSTKPLLSAGLFGFCLVLFIAAAVLHETIIGKIKFHKNLVTINENEIKMLNHQFPGRGHTGDEFKDPDHNYTADLDIFGEKSLFHYINRAVTAMGRKWLAQWLKNQADPTEIKNRQDAVTELSAALDLRQTIAAHGMLMDDSSQKSEALYSLLKEPFMILGRNFLKGFIYIWPAVTLGAAVLIFFRVPWGIFLGFFLSQVVINKLYAKKVSHLYSLTCKSHKILKAYSRIIGEIEKENYHSVKLKDLKKRLSIDGQEASLYIRRFSVLLEWFDTRNGSIHFLVNNVLFWDFHCIYRIEKWLKKSAGNVPQWFDVIGEFEALSGFASYRFNNPGQAMPEIVVGEVFRMETAALGHPLIPQSQRVCNDFALNPTGTGNGNLAIVTGPNMAGKSTFLRAVGVNIVLAFAGAPVCAASFKISPLELFSSMQTTDSLDKHLSLFYAELQRLKMILDGISQGRPVFFLIDEMLKGTNAVDRQKGAIAMSKQLLRNRVNGIVATHDLKLTQLEQPGEWDRYPEGITIANYHFDGYIEDDKLLFDYRLKKGICESFNALILMKKMGIDL